MDTLQTARTLKMLGMVLFLLGLLTGFFIMMFTNPRQGLAAHLEGVMNGTFLVVAGFVWSELNISQRLRKILYWVLLYGTFTNWLFTILGAIWGTAKMTPIAGAGYTGNELHETIVSAGLVLVGLTMVFALVVLIYGLRGKANQIDS
ncbi:MAG: hydrogenase [Ignavibacteriaceae bacterium]|nr:hydrogenase [Ignavibacteriaceae bacterium]